MPKYLKIFLFFVSILVVVALMMNVIGGRSYSTTRGVLKLSGIQNYEELGKHTYRQIYPQFGKANQVFWYTGNGYAEVAPGFFQGMNTEAKRLNHPEWKLQNFESGVELQDKTFYLVSDNSLFRESRKENSVLPKKSRLVFHLDELIHPTKMKSFPENCNSKDRLFEVDCVKATIAIKAAAKWDRIKACTKVSVDQVENYDYLVLINSEDCD